MTHGPRAQPDWVRLGRLKRAVLRELGGLGVVRVEHTIAFSAPFTFWVWLGTTTDAGRDALATTAGIDGRLRELCREQQLLELFQGFTAESQETVDRDYEGSWFYRLR